MALNRSGDRDDVLNTDYQSTELTVGTTEVHAKVGASPLTKRQTILLENSGTTKIYVGPTGVATSGTSRGFLLSRKQKAVMATGPGNEVYLISSAAGGKVVVQELS